MFSNILKTLEFCTYHLCIVLASRVSNIQVHGWAKRQDELLRRYLAAMGEIRMLKTELIKANGKNKKTTPSLKLRFAQALAYILTRGDKVYHDSYLSTTRATARKWADKFRHPFRSKKKDLGGRPKVTEEVIKLILTMKENNGQWSSQRISDELLKLGIVVSKGTVSNILKAHGYDPTGDRESKWKKWEGLFKDHVWAMDFFFVETVKSVTCMVFILIDTYTKEILSLQVHEGREGIDTYWVAGNIAQVMGSLKRRPKELIHDRDPLFLGQVARLCAVSEIKEMKTPPQHPVMNVFCERALQSAEFEMTHHIKVEDGNELQKYMDEYKLFFNNYRPHQGIRGHTPKDFAEGKTHPEPISIEQLRQKKLDKITFANGLLQAYRLVDIKKAA